MTKRESLIFSFITIANASIALAEFHGSSSHVVRLQLPAVQGVVQDEPKRLDWKGVAGVLSSEINRSNQVKESADVLKAVLRSLTLAEKNELTGLEKEAVTWEAKQMRSDDERQMISLKLANVYLAATKRAGFETATIEHERGGPSVKIVQPDKKSVSLYSRAFSGKDPSVVCVGPNGRPWSKISFSEVPKTLNAPDGSSVSDFPLITVVGVTLVGSRNQPTLSAQVQAQVTVGTTSSMWLRDDALALSTRYLQIIRPGIGNIPITDEDRRQLGVIPR